MKRFFMGAVVGLALLALVTAVGLAGRGGPSQVGYLSGGRGNQEGQTGHGTLARGTGKGTGSGTGKPTGTSTAKPTSPGKGKGKDGKKDGQGPAPSDAGGSGGGTEVANATPAAPPTGIASRVRQDVAEVGGLLAPCETIADLSPVPGPDAVARTVRHLKLKNGTGKRMIVWVRHRVQNANNEWQWFPSATKGMAYVLNPGQETYLAHRGKKLSASRVRLWAQTADGEKMDEFRNKDLWLVPEQAATGKHRYYAAETEDFTFLISSSSRNDSAGTDLKDL